jgi:hypothetical protein
MIHNQSMACYHSNWAGSHLRAEESKSNEHTATQDERKRERERHREREREREKRKKSVFLFFDVCCIPHLQMPTLL